MLFIVDSTNPARFISVDQTHFAVHNFERSDNPKVTKLSEKRPEIQQTGDLDNLYEAACALDNPIIMSKDEMLSHQVNGEEHGLIESINDRHEVTLAEPDAYKFEPIADRIMFDDMKDRHRFAINETKESLEESDQITVVELPEEYHERLMNFVQKNDISKIAMVGDQMAYAGADRIAVDDFLASSIYDGLSGSALIEAKCHYEDRGHLDISNPKSPQYAINLDARSYALRLDKDGASIMNGKDITDTKPLLGWKRSDADFSKNVEGFLQNNQTGRLNNVVILTEEEYLSSDREDIIAKRNPVNRTHGLRSVISEKDINERERFLAGEVSSPRQVQAASTIKNRWKVPKEHTFEKGATYYVEVSRDERQVGLEGSKKVVNDVNHSQAPTSRSVNEKRSEPDMGH